MNRKRTRFHYNKNTEIFHDLLQHIPTSDLLLVEKKPEKHGG